MRARWSALELGMELRRDKEGVISQFNDFHQTVIGRATTDHQPMRLHAFTVLVIELIAMTMALKNNGLTIGLIGLRTRDETADPVSQPHSAALIGHLALRQHQIDDRMRALLIKLGAISICQSQDVARELDHRHMHAQTEPQVRNILAPRKARRLNLPFDATRTETARHHNTRDIFQDLSVVISHLL